MVFTHFNNSVGYLLVTVRREMSAVSGHDVFETCGLFFNAVTGRKEVAIEVGDPGFLLAQLRETVPAYTSERKGFLQKFFDIIC